MDGFEFYNRVRQADPNVKICLITAHEIFAKKIADKFVQDSWNNIFPRGKKNDPGHYVARQVQKDGVYGYRLNGTIHYFGVAGLNVDTTMFCRTPEGATTKFNSVGWFGGFGCTEDIDDILFPIKNSDVNPSKTNGKATFDIPATAVQQASVDVSAGNTRATYSSPSSIGVLQTLAMFGIPAAALAGFLSIRSFKQRRDW